MSWVCDFCSTCNEEKTLECFVCGQPRSAESIHEEKKRRKADGFIRFNNFICDVVLPNLKVVFVGIIALASIIIIWAIINKIKGYPDDIQLAIGYLAKSAKARIQNLFYISFNNSAFEFTSFAKKCRDLFESMSTVVFCLSGNAKNHFSCYTSCIESLTANASGKIVIFWDKIVSFFETIKINC